LLHAADEVIIAFLCAGIIFTTDVFRRHRYLLLYVQIVRRKTIHSDLGYVTALNAANSDFKHGCSPFQAFKERTL
jgi:hypothetical protein